MKNRKKDIKKRDYRAQDKRLIRQGTFLLDLSVLDSWNQELKEMNKSTFKKNRKKRGGQYQYPETLILFLGYWHIFFNIGFRQVKGILMVIKKQHRNIKVPSYSQINRRFNNLKPELLPNPRQTKGVNAAIDASGLKIFSEGEWRRKKHCKGKIGKKGFLKIHFLVNIKTGEILSFRVTKEDTHDSEKFVPIVKETKKVIDLKKVMGDGAYDTYKIFEFCKDKKIEPAIKVRKNAITKKEAKENEKYIVRRRGQEKIPYRDNFVKKQKENLKKWKKDSEYGKRWSVEGSYSTFKKAYSEKILARKFKNMKNEVALKCHLFNKILIS